MNIKQLYDALGGRPLATTDSRHCPAGSVFFALRGASFDGNRFAHAALEKGCSWAVVDDASVADDPRCILVDDALAAYQAFAREHRRRHDIPVLAITGTNGKTTTKELVAAVLAKKYRVLCTEANYNNDIGVPKTVLGLNAEHEIAVVEMGASHPGDIRRLVECAEPTCGLITNVGIAHIAGFGSAEGVARTKGELYDFLRQHAGSRAFVNACDARLMAMAGGLDTTTYGLEPSPAAAVEGRVVSRSGLLAIEWRRNGGAWHTVESHLVGDYNINNMLAAATIGLHFGVDEGSISDALAEYTPSNGRSQFVTTPRNSLIVDAYNANPTSMEAALRNLAAIDAPHKMVILGDMGELGDASDEAHQRTADLIGTLGIDEAWLIGPAFGKTQCPWRKFASVEEAKEEIAKHCPQDRCILVKGSHSTRLYELPEML